MDLTPEESSQMDAMRTEQEAPAAPPPPQPESAKGPPEPPVTTASPASEPPKPDPERPRTVPHTAFHEERMRRQALERELAELRRPKSEEPDETQDPIGAISRLKGKLQQYEQAQAEQQTIAEIGRQVGARVQAYANDHPEYREQVQYLRQGRANELREMGYSDNDIGRQIEFEEIALGKRALDMDLDPGKMVSSLAKARGWQEKLAPPPAGAGAAPAPLPVTSEIMKAVQESEQQVDRLQRGRRAARSSSGSGGAQVSAEMTLEQILELDGAAFDAASKAFRDRARRSGL